MLIGFAFLWLAMAVAGYGLGFWKIWTRYAEAVKLFVSLGDAGLGGLLALGGIGTVLHFFIPLSPSLALGLTSVGVILFIALAWNILRHWNTIHWAFLVLCALDVCLQAQLDAVHPDAGIYYIPGILWNTGAPLIPGLANLYGQLGLNSISLVLASLFRLPMILWKAAFLLNALLAFFVMLAFFERLFSAARPEYGDRVASLYGLLMLGGFCANHFAFSGNLGSLSADFGPFILSCYIGFLLLSAAGRNDAAALIAWATMLAVLAILIKLSALPLFCGSLLVLLLSRGALSSSRRTTLFTLTLAAALLGCWAMRGLLLSGCAVFPAVTTCVTQLPWAVPGELAVNVSQYVLDYARGSVQDPQSILDWLSPLLTEVSRNHVGRFLLLLCGCALALNMVGILRNFKTPRLPWRAALAPVGIGLAWISFAILKGPALRFYSGGAFLMVYTLLALGVFHFRDMLPLHLLKYWSTSFCVLLAVQAGALGFRYMKGPSKDWPRFDTPHVVQLRTDSGLSIAVSRTEYCWDTPLPCTPYFDSTLQRIPWLDRFYFRGHNTIAYRNGFPPRSKRPVATK